MMLPWASSYHPARVNAGMAFFISPGLGFSDIGIGLHAILEVRTSLMMHQSSVAGETPAPSSETLCQPPGTTAEYYTGYSGACG